jgi:hypothetical protein
MYGPRKSNKKCACAYCNNGETGCGCPVYRMTPSPERNLNIGNPTMPPYVDEKLAAIKEPGCNYTPLPPERVYCLNAPWNSPEYFTYHRLTNAYGLVRYRPTAEYPFLQGN